VITALENGVYSAAARAKLREAAADIQTPVLGITGTGGAGKSSLTDELILRLRLDQAERLRVASCPSTRRASARAGRFSVTASA
jgi:methylmalonyl-CoA mutase